MKKFLPLLFVIGCGEVRHSGNVEATVYHKVQLDIEFIEQYCKEEFPDSEQLYLDCVTEHTAFFIEFIEKAGEQVQQ